MIKSRDIFLTIYTIVFLSSCSGLKNISEPFVPDQTILINKIDSITAVNLNTGWIEQFENSKQERPVIVVQSISDFDLDLEIINRSIQKNLLKTGKVRILNLSPSTIRLTGNELVTKSSADFSITTSITNASSKKEIAIELIQKIWDGKNEEAIEQSNCIILKK